MKTEFLKALEIQRKALEEATKAAAELLKPALKLFMQEHTDVKAVGWTQYTPHFNDGDVCVFRVSDLYFSMEKVSDAGFYDEPWVELDRDYKYQDTDNIVISQKSHSALVKLGKLLSENEDALLAAFGDGVSVVVTAKGVEVEEYDHD